jgi:hypothetical protein
VRRSRSAIILFFASFDVGACFGTKKQYTKIAAQTEVSAGQRSNQSCDHDARSLADSICRHDCERIGDVIRYWKLTPCGRAGPQVIYGLETLERTRERTLVRSLDPG